MRTLEIDREHWIEALSDFSAIHEGWLVSLDVLSPAIGAQLEIRECPLLGVTVEPHDGEHRITIAAARTAADHITHVIDAPTRIWLERTDRGADAALQIESADGVTRILRFRAAVLPETVDGVARLP